MFARQSYEDVEAKYETEETPESINLLVHIPDGFAREHIGAKVEHDFGRVRVHGERSLGNNRRARFTTLYQVPEYCDINKIKGKFDGKVITITIPTIPEKVPKKEPQATEQEPTQEAKSNSKNEEGTTDDDQEETVANDHVSKSNIESKEKAYHEASTPVNAAEESMHRKSQEEIPPKVTVTKVESKKHEGQETSTPSKDTEESKSQKGQEEIAQKDTITEVYSKNQVGHEASTSIPPQDTKESMPQKDQEAIPPNAKVQGEKKFEEEIDGNEQKQKAFGKKETEDHSKKTLESEKPPKKDIVDDSPKKEGKEESNGLESFEREKGTEINGKISNDVVRKKSDKKIMPESTRARIKEVAASASQAMTNLVKKFNEEDKQRIIYMGAAALVVAFGVYATYKLRSHRP